MSNIPWRRRLTDELGETVSCGRFLRHAPLAVLQSCLRVACGTRPVSPWIPFDAAERLRCFLERRPEATVLEYGSGMSTVWLARRAAHVVAVESDAVWMQRVRQLLAANGCGERVRLVHADTRERYVQAGGCVPQDIDLLIIDGDHRLDCALWSMRQCKPDGVIYVDDSDKRAAVPEMQKLVDAVQEYALSVGGRCEFITDFSPAQAFPKQGVIAWLKPMCSPES